MFIFVIFGIPYLAISYYFYFVAEKEDFEKLQERQMRKILLNNEPQHV